MAPWRPGESTDGAGGLPPAAQPGLPGVNGYASLDAELTDLGFQHAARLLDPRWAPGSASSTGDGEGFRVLDGLWFPERGFRWRRVDKAFVRDIRTRWTGSGDPRARPVADVLTVLEGVLRDDPMGLRRLVLWQLCCLLKDGEPGAAAAERLGVHTTEAGLLADAVAAGFPAAGPARRAAERIADVVRRRALREAARLAADLPAVSADPMLNDLLAGIHEGIAEADLLMDDAVRSERRGLARAASRAWLRAHRLVADDPRAYTGLLGTAALIADEPDPTGGPGVDAAVARRSVRLSWPSHAVDGVTFTVLRFPEGEPQNRVEVRGPDPVPFAADADVPVGVRLRYVVVPRRGGRIAGVPRATSPVVLLPAVARLRAVPVPDGARLEWRTPPEAAGVKVTRSPAEAGARPVPVPCGRDGLLDRPLELGRHDYVISCGYAGPDGGTLWSPGRRVTVEVKPWPDPVEELTVRPLGDGGRVGVACRPPESGDAFLVRWPFRADRPDEDVSELLGRLPGDARVAAGPLGSEPRVELAAPPGTALRLAAVSVLGGIAVAGPCVVIENPAAVRDLRVRRLWSDRAEVRFTWPEPAVLVLLRWQRDGVALEARIPRSRFRAEGRVVILVSRDRHEITVAAVPRPDAVHIAAEPATAVLAARVLPVRVLPERVWPGAQPEDAVPGTEWAFDRDDDIEPHEPPRTWRRWLRRLNPFRRN